MSLTRFFARVTLGVTLWAVHGAAQPDFITFPSDIDWVTRKSPHFTAVYRRGQDALAERALGYGEEAYAKLHPLFPKGPEHTWMVLADFLDSTNGYALNVPYPHMVVFASPPEPNGLLAHLDDWLRSVILHEYVHTLHIYPASGLWSTMRGIFGSWVMPNALMPSHLHEGIATFAETQFTEGGRGRAAPFRMIRRKAVEAGVWGKDFAPLDLLDGSATRWPHGIAPYFFGYQLYDALWKLKGAEGFKALTQSYSNNWPYYLDTPLEDIYGVDYELTWERIFALGEQDAKQELEGIRKAGLSKLNYLTETRQAKWDLVAAPAGDRIAYRSAGWDRASELVFYDPAQKKVTDALPLGRTGNDGLCWGKREKQEGLFLIEASGRYGYRKNYLKYHDLPNRTRYQTQLEGKNIDYVQTVGCSDDLSHLYVYREVGGVGTLLHLKGQLPGPGQAGRTDRVREWRLPPGTWISSIQVGPRGDGWFLLREGMKTTLHAWPADELPRRVVVLDGHAYHLRPGEGDGSWLLLWDRDGRSEVWEVQPKGEKIRKRVALSGGASGFARLKDRWVVASYEHGGFDLAEATPAPGLQAKFRKKPAVKTVRTRNSSRKVAQISETQEYSAWASLMPQFWVPFLMVVPDGLQFSAWIPGFDIGQKHFYGLFTGYDTRGSAFVSASHSYRFGLTSTLNTSAYFQPSYIISARQLITQWGGSVSVGGRLWDGPSVSFGMNFKKLEASRAAPGQTQFNATPKWSVGPSLGVGYSFDVEQEPQAVLPRWGTSVGLNVSAYPQAAGSSDDYVTTIATFVQHLPVPWYRKHGFFLRGRFGLTEGTSLINSYFEGGGELLFSFGRGAFLNRGFPPGTFLARRIFTLNAEYHFLLSRPERGFGLMPVFFRSWQGALVADLSTHDLGTGPPPTRVKNERNLFRLYYASVGAELKGNFKIGYYLPLSLRIGAYRGFGGSGGSRPQGEPFYFVTAIEGSFL